jgi:hypothetical protein
MAYSESTTLALSYSGDELTESADAPHGEAMQQSATREGESEKSQVDESSPPVASLLPWQSSESESDIEVKLYIVTGYHGKLKVPESFCRECHLFVRAADAAAAQVDADVRVSVASWWTHFPFALRYGGYHPPVIVVDGARLSQGHQVPTTREIVEAIQESVG